jgi:hypothetical protein
VNSIWRQRVLGSNDQELNMASGTAETVPAIARSTRTDGSAEKPATRARRPRANESEEESGFTRYFLAKRDGDGSIPALDRELTSEGEALVEALRSGVTFYAIQEFRVIPDFASRRPQLQKEVVHGKQIS